MFFAGVCSNVAGLAPAWLRFDDALTALNFILQRREQSAVRQGFPQSTQCGAIILDYPATLALPCPQLSRTSSAYANFSPKRHRRRGARSLGGDELAQLEACPVRTRMFPQHRDEAPCKDSRRNDPFSTGCCVLAMSNTSSMTA